MYKAKSKWDGSYFSHHGLFVHAAVPIVISISFIKKMNNEDSLGQERIFFTSLKRSEDFSEVVGY